METLQKPKEHTTELQIGSRFSVSTRVGLCAILGFSSVNQILEKNGNIIASEKYFKLRFDLYSEYDKFK